MEQVIINKVNNNFLLLWTGKFVSEIGDKIYAIAMAWWIMEQSGSAIIMGLYLASSVLPGILLGLVSGAYVDRFETKKFLVGMDCIRGVVIVGMGVLYFFGMLQIWHAFTLTIIISIASSFFNPAVVKIIPKIVDNNSLGRANSFMQMIDGIATIFGPIVGAAAIGLIGYFWIFSINGLSYLLSALFESFISIRKNVNTEMSEKEELNIVKEDSIIDDVKIGLGYLRRHTELKKIMIMISVAHFFVGAISVTMPYMAKFISESNIHFLGFMHMALGSGFLLGAILASRRKSVSFKPIRLIRYLIGVGFCFIGIGLITVLSIKGFALYVFIIFLIGFSIVNASIYWQTFIQTNTPENMLGRISSVALLIGDVTLPISYALFGVLLSVIDFKYLMILCGSILVLFLLTQIRRMNSN